MVKLMFEKTIEVVVMVLRMSNFLMMVLTMTEKVLMMRMMNCLDVGDHEVC